MAFDSLIMQAVTEELRAQISGMSVQRIYQPGRSEIVIHFYNNGKQVGLLISVDSRNARVHLTDRRYQSQDQPSPFCMLLRKYLIGARVASFTNPPLERVLEINFDPPDGMPAVKLLAEIMSQRSNLILVNTEGLILGAARTASWVKNPVRAVMPGEMYRPVPPQNKLDPVMLDQNIFASMIELQINSGKSPEQSLFNTVQGVSPQIARELLFKSNWDENELLASSQRLLAETKQMFLAAADGRYDPVMVPDKNTFAAFSLTHLGNHPQISFASVNKMLDQFFDRQVKQERENLLREQLRGTVTRRLARLDKKRLQQEKELLASTEAPLLRQYGDLLLTYGDNVPRGADHVVLPDLYDSDLMVTVPLDPSKSASANAQKYFNRYRRAKKGQTLIQNQLNITGTEIDYCQELIYTIDGSTETSLEEIRQELIDGGYLRDKKKPVRKKNPAPQPLLFRTSAGHTVMVGRNNRQNEYITFKAAARRDTWFHVRALPGSHVLLKEAPFPPSQEDIEEAAYLAACYSKGRDSVAVAVDYTEVRHVRRRPGGKPGSVFYENFETITVNPQNEQLKNKFFLGEK
ncbi:MAG TPA: NFACT RNA binding domain-containing protein [Candidatus Limnocylindrales bacterium]|nr:NFACT RNA binding domain-containing protein [Candidatus Limnocylindrales bacterium]